MRRTGEFLTYLSVSAGMALAVSCFTVFSLLFQSATTAQIVVALALAGVLCLGVAGTIAELAGRFPSSGGLRTYVKAAFGDSASLFVVYMYLGLVLLIAGVESYVFAGVVAQFMPEMPRWLTIIVLLGAVIMINVVGMELPGRVQTVLTLSLLIGLLAIALFALQFAPPSLPAAPQAERADWGLLPQLVCLAFFMYVGFEWVVQVGRDPAAYRRMIPSAMLVAIMLLGVTYGLFALALGAHLEPAQIAGTQTPQIALGGQLLGDAGRGLLAFMSVLAILTSFNAGLLGATRLMYALSREGHLPRWCATISPRSGAPVGAVLTLGGAAMVSAILIDRYQAYGAAAALSAVIVCVSYVSLLAAAWRLKSRELHAGGTPGQNRIPAVVQVMIALVLTGVAAATALSTPSLAAQCAGLVAIAGGLTWGSLAHAKKARCLRQSTI
ncbi:MAG: APC family permease [Pseudomonadota bacterium]